MSRLSSSAPRSRRVRSLISETDRESLCDSTAFATLFCRSKCSIGYGERFVKWPGSSPSASQGSCGSTAKTNSGWNATHYGSSKRRNCIDSCTHRPGIRYRTTYLVVGAHSHHGHQGLKPSMQLLERAIVAWCIRAHNYGCLRAVVAASAQQCHLLLQRFKNASGWCVCLHIADL